MRVLFNQLIVFKEKFMHQFIGQPRKKLIHKNSSFVSETHYQCPFLFSDGTRVNGSELIRGIRACTDNKVVITGGLAGDGPRFGTRDHEHDFALGIRLAVRGRELRDGATLELFEPLGKLPRDDSVSLAGSRLDQRFERGARAVFGRAR